MQDMFKLIALIIDRLAGSQSVPDADQRARISKLDELLVKLEERAAVAQTPTSLDEDQIRALEESLVDRINEQAVSEVIEKHAEARQLESADSVLRSGLDATRQRLMNGKNARQKQGLLSLVLGLGISGLGIVMLYSTLSLPEIRWESAGLRVTLAMFVQVVGFFFLRLYRSSLESTRYYENELTNIESHTSAARTAAALGDPGVLNEILMHLAQTERNFKLGKGESSIELRREALNQTGDKQSFEQTRKTWSDGNAATKA